MLDPVASLSMKCPRCQLGSPQAAVNCNCGHNFQTGAFDGPARYVPPYRNGQRAPGRAVNNDILYGGLICLAGIVITIGTMATAQHGGSYVVAWGAIIFGGIRFFRGLANR